MASKANRPTIDEQRRSEIERQAESILAQIPAWIWDGQALPVPVDEIAARFDLLIREVDDLTAVPGCPPLSGDDHLSGLLIADRGEIWVNAGEASNWPPRRRFTICHELGHWFLHRGRNSGEPVFCRSADVDSDEEAALIEEEANVFASAMLMPATLVAHHYEATGGSHPKLCQIFGASQKAMGRRMHTAIPRS